MGILSKLADNTWRRPNFDESIVATVRTLIAIADGGIDALKVQCFRGHCQLGCEANKRFLAGSLVKILVLSQNQLVENI